MPAGTVGRARKLYYRDSDEHGAYTLYFKEIRRFKLLSDEEVEPLVARVRKHQDIQARNQLVEHNLRLVVTVVKKFQGLGLELLDLIQEGSIGLMRAAELYDPGLARFSTYAHIWIEQAVRRALDEQSRVIRVPVHALERIRKFKKVHKSLEHELGREPLPQELAEKLDLLIEEIEQTVKDMRVTTVTFEDLSPSDQDQDQQDIDYLAVLQDNRTTPEEALMLREEQDRVEKELNAFLSAVAALKGVSERNKTIFLLRHGLDGTFTAKTLEVIGEKFHMTRERVRQIVSKVLGRLQEECPAVSVPLFPKLQAEGDGKERVLEKESTASGEKTPTPRTVVFSLKEHEKKALDFIGDFLKQKDLKTSRRAGVCMALDRLNEELKGHVPKEVRQWFVKRMQVQATIAYGT